MPDVSLAPSCLQAAHRLAPSRRCPARLNPYGPAIKPAVASAAPPARSVAFRAYSQLSATIPHYLEVRVGPSYQRTFTTAPQMAAEVPESTGNVEIGA